MKKSKNNMYLKLVYESKRMLQLKQVINTFWTSQIESGKTFPISTIVMRKLTVIFPIFYLKNLNYTVNKFLKMKL